MALPKSLTRSIWKIFKVVNIAIILGFTFGSLLAILHIAANRYYEYKLHNIILFYIQEYVTAYLLIFTFIALAILLSGRAVIWILSSNNLKLLNNSKTEDKTSLALYYSLFLIFILGILLYTVYPEVLSYLNKIGLRNQIKDILRIWEEFKMFSIIIYIILALIFVPISTYLLIRFNIVNAVNKRLFRIMDTIATITLGLVIVAMVITFNVFVFSYKHYNSTQGPNVILILIDTLRADRLGSYGYVRNTSPHLDRLAEKGMLYENAYSQAPWTLPSMASMHTSYYPTQMGMNSIKIKLHDSYITLAEYMKNNFYETSAIVANVVVSEIFGFSQGFDKFDQRPLKARDYITSHLVSDYAINYLSDNRSNKFFLWLHYIDPHSTYNDHPEFGYGSNYSGQLGQKLSSTYLNNRKMILSKDDIEYVSDVYDEEISYTDKHVGRVLDSLTELGISNNTIIIITSDHGEELLDRTRYGHQLSLYQELIHVPLIIYVPSEKGPEPKRVKSGVEVRGIAKTILDLCGIENNHFGGENLLIVDENEVEETYAFSQKAKGKEKFPKLEAISSGKWKLIKNLQDNSYELYDLESDPGEESNLFHSKEADKNVIKNLISKSSSIEKESEVETVEVEFKEEDIEKLKALGYIQ